MKNVTKQTAMQEILEDLQKQFDEQKFPIVIDGTKYLEKEKEQIIEAYLTGAYYTTDEEIILANEYYNKTYNL